MADFQNLIGEIDSTQHTQENDDEPTFELPEQDVATTRGASIPAALLEEEARREEQERETYLTQNTHDEEEDGNKLSPDEDYEALKRLWIQELNSTDLLKYDHEIIPMLMEMVSAQEEVIEQFQEQAHQNSSLSVGQVDSDLASLAASICKLDLDRICFLLADLSRIRLGKIEKYPFHNVEHLDLMSDQEVSFLQYSKQYY